MIVRIRSLFFVPRVYAESYLNSISFTHIISAVAEPPLTMSIVVIFALRYALESARRDAGIKYNPWFKLSEQFDKG